MGASGNVGACVTRHLVAGGADVRVLLRKTSSTKGVDGLEVERHYGDISDTAQLAAALSDRDVVYYCIVDTRAELRDPAPLFDTNVNSLRKVLDVAVTANLQRFVFLSTIGTIAIGQNGETVDEDTPFNWADRAGSYIESRRQAEQLVFSYVADHGLPAVVANVSTHTGRPTGNRAKGCWCSWPHWGSCRSTSAASGPKWSVSTTWPTRCCSPPNGTNRPALHHL
jgi:nucleoside-diphosphate-sugar epimerase